MKIRAAARLRALDHNEDSMYLGAALDVTDEVLAECDIPHDTLGAFGKVVRTHLTPGVEQVRHQLDEVIKHASGKVKAWAMVHLREAQLLGRPTHLFEKLINDPEAATAQIAKQLLGMPKAPTPNKVDDVLEDIQL